MRSGENPLAADALTAPDVADLLHISKNAVYALAREGKIGSYRIGRKLRFSLSDVEAYLQLTRAASSSCANQPDETADPQSPPRLATLSANARSSFVIAGHDMVADMLANVLGEGGVDVSRSFLTSYDALRGLYAGTVDAAFVHLYDLKTDSYNVPYVRCLAPGVPVLVVRIITREQGFIVARGNPKRLSSWTGLFGRGVRLANTVRGCGGRVLLDQKMAALEARPHSIEGYARELDSPIAAASMVALGAADVSIGTKRIARHFDGVEFVPLQTERLDVVLLKSKKNAPVIRAIKRALASAAFRREVCLLEDAAAVQMGAIAYDC